MKIISRWQVLDCRTDPASVYHLQVVIRQRDVVLERENIVEGESNPSSSRLTALMPTEGGNLIYLKRPEAERAKMLVRAERFIEALESRFCFVFSVDSVNKA